MSNNKRRESTHLPTREVNRFPTDGWKSHLQSRSVSEAVRLGWLGTRHINGMTDGRLVRSQNILVLPKKGVEGNMSSHANECKPLEDLRTCMLIMIMSLIKCHNEMFFCWASDDAPSTSGPAVQRLLTETSKYSRSVVHKANEGIRSRDLHSPGGRRSDSSSRSPGEGSGPGREGGNVVQRTDWQTEGRTEAYGSSGEETRDGERKSAGRPVMLKGSTGDFGEAGGSLTEEAFSAGQWGANGVREKTRK